ncbi:MAG TPA: nuclear transport factor 2 family protein [Anaerolineae bacterium]
MASSTRKPAVDSYFTALSNLDRDAYLACFRQDALVRDPYGGRPLHGEDGLNKFMDGLERTWDEFQMTPDQAFTAGDRVAVSWTAKGRAKSGKTANFAGVNVFTLDEDGLIRQLDGYWDFKEMAAQIQ